MCGFQHVICNIAFREEVQNLATTMLNSWIQYILYVGILILALPKLGSTAGFSKSPSRAPSQPKPIASLQPTQLPTEAGEVTLGYYVYTLYDDPSCRDVGQIFVYPLGTCQTYFTGYSVMYLSYIPAGDSSSSSSYGYYSYYNQGYGKNLLGHIVVGVYYDGNCQSLIYYDRRPLQQTTCRAGYSHNFSALLPSFAPSVVTT